MRTVSTKLDNRTHNQFIELCNNEGKCQSEFLRDVIESICDDLEEDEPTNLTIREVTPQDPEIKVEDVEQKPVEATARIIYD